MVLTAVIFIAAISFVFVFSYLRSRGVNKESKDGFFLGGRSLTASVIAVGLLLNNNSATHFVGMTGDVWFNNMSTIGFEITSGLCLAITGIFLIPRYLKQGITTIPDYLEQRFDVGTKRLATYIVIFAYLANMLPITLYSGSVVLVNIFGIDKVLGVSYATALTLCVVAICVIGSIYALYGGLKMVATADIINGILLVVGGALVPIFGFLALGHGNFFSGIGEILVNHPEKLNSIGSPTDINPFGTTFTGVFLLVMYFWGTDQSILQRALAAKNLKHGQKGVMIAGCYKLFTPLLLMVPGLIAFRLFELKGVAIQGSRDQVYPTLANMVLPPAVQGLFVAAMFGAVLSTFSGLLNSTTTLLSLNVIVPHSKKKLTGKEMVKIGRRFGVVVAVFAMIIAPLLMYTPSGLYTYLQQINGFTNIPILIMMGVGYLNKKCPAISAKIAAVMYMIGYGLSCVLYPQMNYLHRIGINFAVAVAFMIIYGAVKPVEKEFVLKNTHVVNMKPWKYRYSFTAFLVATMSAIYVLLSPAGLANKNGATIMTIVYMFIAAGISIAIVYLIKLLVKEKEEIFYSDCVDTVPLKNGERTKTPSIVNSPSFETGKN